ncbi:GGDEF domain-containing protein [Rhizobium changzhiense]|uniref:diguanylate cyclase n=1 Tax=Rhizobium changzhiense TaxID=2692317 RepID=A0A7Z0REF0_9HYPH|nr:sensor domain-containing diguanylate cyclase [Rhizobium changzhiense]MBA5803930.1 GGDEF domain-containing protein [Rhizobium changzhiense]NNU46082.1 GGDEF domain-containing protein [Rhizobium changzhiense]NZD60017.1 GGDEF domain-containing protein [Rhizobium changzhiense]
MFLDEDREALVKAELTKQTLVDTQARMGMMLDLMPMGLLIHTRQGIIFGNQEASRLLQVPQDQVVGRHFLDFLQTQVDEAAQQMEEAFEGQISEISTEADIRTAEGAVRTIKLIAGALPWDGNPVVQLLLQDITDLKTIQNALHRLTITDELTGAFNRRHAFSVANRFFNSTHPSPHALAVAVLDIDHFKRVNDTYGHAAGDIALKTLSQTVRELISTPQLDGATFARVGGEEFLLLLPDMESDAVIAACEHVRCAVEQQPIVTACGVFHATVSIGVALRRPTDGSFDSMFSNADRALYRAKESGRNRVCIDEESPGSPQRLTATE